MTENVELKKKTEKYSGKFVATRSFDATEVISFGKDPKKVHDDAKKKGVRSPVVFYVPPTGMINLY